MANPNGFSSSESGYGYNDNDTERSVDDYLVEYGEYPGRTQHDDGYRPGENIQAAADDIAFQRHLAELAAQATAKRNQEIVTNKDTQERQAEVASTDDIQSKNADTTQDISEDTAADDAGEGSA